MNDDEGPPGVRRPERSAASATGISQHPSRAVATGELGEAELAFYRDAMLAMASAGVPFLVGGAHALLHYAGFTRFIGDFDAYVRPSDPPRASDALAERGLVTELTYPHWLAKACRGEHHLDLIFSSGNGVAEVDDAWFDNAPRAEVFDVDVQVVPPEELVWSKAYIMERERFDGADVAHLLLALAERLDWTRLVVRFGPHWHVLLSHLVLFEFIYPGELQRVPAWVVPELVSRLEAEMRQPRSEEKGLCRGTLLSRAQYLMDVEQRGWRDARVDPHGRLSAADVASWTRAMRRSA